MSQATKIRAIKRYDEVVVTIDGVPYVVAFDDDRYDDVLSALEVLDVEELEDLLTTSARAERMFEELSEYHLERDGSQFTYYGNPVPMDLSDYLLNCLDGGTWVFVVRFIQRLFENTNDDTRSRLFMFVDANKLPITATGCFVAYKAVTSDYRDKWTKTIDNRPGTTVPTMAPYLVDTSSHVTCSRGYHACSREYLMDSEGNNGGYYSLGDKVITVAVPPELVASVPIEYQNSKLRCRGYTVLNDITPEFEAQARRLEMTGMNRIGPVGAMEEMRFLNREIW